MKTLAIDCRMARMSGIGVYLRHLAPLCMALLADAVRFRLLGYDGAFDIPAGVSYTRAPFGAPIYSIAEQYRILPLLHGCDALWLPHYPVPVLTGVPLVVTVHDVAHLALPDIFTGVRKAYARLMFQAVRRKAAETLFVSRFSQREFLLRVGAARGGMTVAHNGVGREWFALPLGRAPARPSYFLAIGNIKPHKNIRLLCRAFSMIAGKCGASLLLAGESAGFRSREEPADLGIACDRIHFTGAIRHADLLRLVRGASALVFPSRYEGFGLPPLEALAAGIPVVAADIASVREVCGAHPKYFSPDSAEQCAQCLLETLALSDEARRARGEMGREHARNFTWEKSAGITARVLGRTLGVDRMPLQPPA